MNSEIGFAFILVAALAFGIWHRSKSHVSIVEPHADGAGTGFVPEVPMSNSPFIEGIDWQTPYYLRANYPANRNAGMVVPSIVTSSVADSFGPQEINPSL